MIDIKQIKISLMEKKGDVQEEVGLPAKADYIIKSSATLKFNEYIDLNFPGIDDNSREIILKEASQLMYQDLLGKTKDPFDSIGVWLTVGDQIYENSIALSAMEGIQEYGEKGIVPIYELVKMTIPENG
jgi:hypothetical protein